MLSVFPDPDDTLPSELSESTDDRADYSDIVSPYCKRMPYGWRFDVEYHEWLFDVFHSIPEGKLRRQPVGPGYWTFPFSSTEYILEKLDVINKFAHSAKWEKDRRVAYFARKAQKRTATSRTR